MIAARVAKPAHSIAQIFAAFSSANAVSKSGGRPWIAHRIQLPWRFPDDTNAVRNPAMTQKAMIPTAVRIPSAEMLHSI